MTVLPQQKMDALLARHALVESELASGLAADAYVKLSREFAELTPVVEVIKAYRSTEKEIAELSALVNDSGTDAEMRKLADIERRELQERMESLTQQIRLALLPKDAMDDHNAILEIRAGTGGDEAALFAGDLFRMYERYAAKQGWRTEILSQRRHERRLQGNRRRGSGPRCLRQAQVRIGRASCATRTRYRGLGSYPHLGSDRCRSSGSGGCRHPHQRVRPQDRHHARRELVDSTSTRPNLPSASRTFQVGLSYLCRRSGRSTKINPRR